MKIFKFLMLGIGFIVLLVVIAVGIFLATFDANQYKEDLSQLVSQQTGRNLVFEGDIGLTLYPALGMKLGSMSFSNAPGFGNKPMLAVKKASASVDVLSLLSFKPQIAQLVLDGLHVDLQKNKQGKTNWDDLVPSSDEGQAVAGESAEVEKADPDSQPIDLAGAFGGLNITNANLTWSDRSGGVEYRVQNLSLVTGRITPELPFPLQLSLDVESINEFSSAISLTTDVLFKKQNLTLSSLKLETSAQGKLIPLDTLQLSFAGDVDFSLMTNQLAVRGFSTKIKTSGGVLQSTDVSIAGEVGFDLNKQQLMIAVLDFQADLADPTLPGGHIKTGLSASKLDLQLDKRAVSLDGLTLALNENQFKGYVKVLDYEKPAVNFELASDYFDVDKLLGTSAGQETPGQSVEQESAATEDVQIQLPMELLRSLQMDGKLSIGTLIAQGLTLSDVLLKVDANKGIVALTPLKMNLYEGSFAGSVQVDARGEKPAYKVKKKLTSFQIGKFLKDFMGDDLVSGTANMDVNLTTQGEWLSQLKSGLNGNMSVELTDGALKGFNLRHSIDAARARLKGKKVPEQVARKTDFSALSISGNIKNGIFSTDDLNMQAPLVRVGGKGSVDLVRESVDYRVNAKLVTTTKGQQGGTADDLSGLLIPVAITGPWLSPKIDVQLDEMLKAKLNADKAKISQQVAKEKAQLQQKLSAQKAKLKAAQDKKAAAEKAQLDKKKQLAEAEQKAKLEAEKKKAKQNLKDKLKKLF